MSLSTEDRRLIAVSGSGVRAPQGLVPNGPSSWHRPRSDAELVIISHPSLLPEAAPLVARRQAEGWKVAVVSVDDLYDEFTYGEKDPAAIRTFLSHARTTWPAPPKAVLLLGDATFDPRNFLAKGSFDLVPTKLIDTDDLETSSDDWFVDWNGDHEPDLPIGRLPVRTPEEARLVIGRIVAFEPKAATALGDSRILFLGDYDPQPALDFPTGIRDIRTSLPPALQVTEVLRSALGDAAARQSLSDGLAASPFLFNYVGHGTTEMWGGSWLSSKAVMTMWSPRPVALMMATTCLNGFFHDVYTRSMAEALLTMPGGGAVASIGSSSLAELPDQVLLTEAVYRLSLGEGRPLGEALQLAKRGLRDHEVQRTYMLFGDPAAVLVAPAAKIAALAVEPEAGLPGGCSIARPAPDPGHAIGSGILLAALALVRRFGRRGAGASRPPRRWRSGVGAPPR